MSESQSCKEVIVSADTAVFELLKDNPSQLISRGEQYCPRVEVLARELYVPNNVPQELSLTLTNLPPDLLAAGAASPPQFLCQVGVACR
jgi:hypothetical protein